MPTVLFEKLSNGVARVMLNRPEKLNAMDSASKALLGDIWAEIAADPDIRAVALTGVGERAFCAGSDLKEVQRTGRAVATDVLLRAIPGAGIPLDKPVVTALHGYSIGFGLTLALHSDLTVCAADTQMGFPEVKHGMLTAVSATRLARMVPTTRAMEMLLLGDNIAPVEAQRIGLITRVVEGDPRPLAQEIAERIAGYPAAAVQATKRLAMAALDADRPRVAEWVIAARTQVEKDTDFLSGARAFVNRKPQSDR